MFPGAALLVLRLLGGRTGAGRRRVRARCALPGAFPGAAPLALRLLDRSGRACAGAIRNGAHGAALLALRLLGGRAGAVRRRVRARCALPGAFPGAALPALRLLGRRGRACAGAIRRGAHGAALLALCLLGGRGHAAGIPTVDVGVIAQQVRSYQQQLQDFEAQLRQVGLGHEQLTMLNRQLAQTVKEYDDYLLQVRGLNRLISREDWNRLFQVLKRQYGVSAYARIPALRAAGGAGRQAIDAEVGAVYAVPAEVGAARRQVEDIGLEPAPWAARAQRQRVRYEVYRDQLEAAKDGNRELLERHARVRITRQNFNLGDKSDLNALQTAVTSNFHVIDELQALNRVQNQRLLHANHDYMHALSVAEAQRRAEAARLEAAVRRAAPSPSFRWGSLDVTAGGGR